MSTKIYTGFIFKNKSLMQVHKEIMKFRAEAKKIVYEEVKQWQSRRIAYLIDAHALGALDKELESEFIRYGPLYMTWREISRRKRGMDNTGYRDPEIDFTFSMAILPLRRKILGIYYGENKRLIDPVKFEEGAWWFYEETWSARYGPFSSREEAYAELSEYARRLEDV